MKKLFYSVFALLLAVSLTSCSQYKYETIEGDPTNSRIYTLDNGLKVYMSVNKDEPRIEAYIPVRVGSKNDPSETTGLAHYFEHLMFKGSESFGTSDYAAEKPLLDAIEAQFEIYRNTTDPEQRTAIYRVIDSLSFEASKYNIPNEYDKLMAAIGSNMSNAYTSVDQTVYMENIPSNQIENWAKIQSDRFGHNVIRGFHTELEIVYEEKNMSLTQDSEKVFDEMFAALFKKHPYGLQTVLGTQEHLKNPSITNIKNYYKEWYVPNNMAICLSGDFDPDKTIKIIDKYFSILKPNKNLKKLQFEAEDPILTPIVKDVYGLESPSVTLGWRFPGMNSSDLPKMELLNQVIFNGSTGLIDLNVNQRQEVLNSFAFLYTMADYSTLLFQGTPKEGQTLEEVQNILLQQVENLKRGYFSDDLIPSIVNNYKRDLIKVLESNDGRIATFVNSFTNDVPLVDLIKMPEAISKITKEELVSFANEMLKDNYAVIRKLEGKDESQVKISKPSITPILTNREMSSAFLTDIQNSVVKPIDPVFVDYKKDMSILSSKSNIPILYKQNTTNDLFELSYIFDMGENEDRLLSIAAMYMNYVGTSQLSANQIKEKFYSLACDFQIYPSKDRTEISLSGLSENMKEALSLLESLLIDAQSDKKAYVEMISGIIQERENDKLSQERNFAALRAYGTYGPKSPQTNLLSTQELKNLDDLMLISRIHDLNRYEHKVLYYGPMTKNEIVQTINDLHLVADYLTPIKKNDSFKQLIVEENSVLIAPYDAKQIYLDQISNRGETFDLSITPILSLYNTYFGSGMNSIVFQEMREVRGLAYSAKAGLSTPSDLKENYAFSAFIATQNDKMIDALTAFDDIINNIPQSQKAFDIAKESLITTLRTSRIMKSQILWSYLRMEKLGLDIDLNQYVFDNVQKLTLDDVISFQQNWVKDRKYTICILGNENDLDLKSLEKYGPIRRVSTEEIFGY